jgi:hypothetical protein
LNSEISEGMPKAKAIFWLMADAEVRRHKYQVGLDTPLVCAVNYVGSSLDFFRDLANALNRPPEDYDRKIKTQRN